MGLFHEDIIKNKLNVVKVNHFKKQHAAAVSQRILFQGHASERIQLAHPCITRSDQSKISFEE